MHLTVSLLYHFTLSFLHSNPIIVDLSVMVLGHAWWPSMATSTSLALPENVRGHYDNGYIIDTFLISFFLFLLSFSLFFFNFMCFSLFFLQFYLFFHCFSLFFSLFSSFFSLFLHFSPLFSTFLTFPPFFSPA